MEAFRILEITQLIEIMPLYLEPTHFLFNLKADIVRI
jgi:hypothetical protein